tara:strand:+ start:6251 stop:6583 length:333 start_codon:yes stop_codon:yes gene_type:complete
MTFARRAVSLAGLAAAAFTFALVPGGLAQDAMATDAMATDAMSADAMAPMSDDDLALCLEQAGMISFATAMAAAEAACHDMHNGMMGDAMATDAMAPDAMATDAMAPAKP